MPPTLPNSLCGLLLLCALGLAPLTGAFGQEDLLADISHAFVQTDSELHYFRDVSGKELHQLTAG